MLADGKERGWTACLDWSFCGWQRREFIFVASACRTPISTREYCSRTYRCVSRVLGIPKLPPAEQVEATRKGQLPDTVLRTRSFHSSKSLAGCVLT